MPAVIDVSKTDDPRDVVHRAVQALAEGKLVAFPTESAYEVAASALHAGAVERLASIVSRFCVGDSGSGSSRSAASPASDPPAVAVDASMPQHASSSGNGATQKASVGGSTRPITVGRCVLGVRSCDEALDYAPSLSLLGQRLARRCWPGPLTLEVEETSDASLLGRLPAATQSALLSSGRLGLRVPAHGLIQSAMRLAVGPLVLATLPDTGGAGIAEGGGTAGVAVSAADVLAAAGDKLALVLDDGRTRFAAPTSVAWVRGRELRVTQAGILNESTLLRLSSLMVLFVCTGNTCRSPMAEVLMRKRAARRMGCSLAELADRGVLVMSAGIAAMSGSAASPEAHDAVSDRGLELTQHESQPVTDRLVRFADLIVTMTRGHRDALLAQWPEAAARTKLLSRANADVSDPIGGPLELYRRCADQIDGYLSAWEDEIAWDTLPLLHTERASDPSKGS